MTINPAARRRRRFLTRAIPLTLLAVIAFAAGTIVGSGSTQLAAAQRFADAWVRQDFRAMHEELTPAAAGRYPLARFEAAYRRAQMTATVASIDDGGAEAGTLAGGATGAVVPIVLHTHAFGTLSYQLHLPLVDGRVDWTPNLVFPGLAPGERLERKTRVPQRAPILARDGTPLAEGPAAARSSPLGAAAQAVVGTTALPRHDVEQRLYGLGFPAGTPTGASGLELAFDQRLRGKPGGQLLAVGGDSGSRVLATSEPKPGKPVHTTIDPLLQREAVTALGGSYGGVAVLDARDGSVRALAGIAFSGPQPPGSTFKVITTTAALEAGVVKLSDTFPIQTSATVGGRVIANANNEACGGTFVQAFAESCNSVFVPLGPKIGSERMVGTAERFGFNSKPSLYDAKATRIADPKASTLPKSIPDDLDLGVTAIGQGQVLATPLEMASVAQTIANGGVRDPTPIVTDPALRPRANPVRATSTGVAATLRNLMIQVVASGTGTAAQIPGVQVAGKTGTAELGPSALQPGQKQSQAQQRVDAWFTSFAPAGDPKLVVAVMIVDAGGAGGEVAAPIARQILEAGLAG